MSKSMHLDKTKLCIIRLSLPHSWARKRECWPYFTGFIFLEDDDDDTDDKNTDDKNNAEKNSQGCSGRKSTTISIIKIGDSYEFSILLEPFINTILQLVYLIPRRSPDK